MGSSTLLSVGVSSSLTAHAVVCEETRENSCQRLATPTRKACPNGGRLSSGQTLKPICDGNAAFRQNLKAVNHDFWNVEVS